MTAELAKVRAERLAWERLHKQLLDRVIRAQEEERKRIARELHDETSQSLTSLMVGLQRIQQLHPAPEIQAQVEELRSIAVSALDGVHNLAQELRPSVLDEMGLVDALEKYVNEYRKRYPLEVDYVTRGFNQQRLPPIIATAVYRIVQEGLTNVVRHANAASVSILLEMVGDRTRIFIEDDGCGFEPEQIDGSGDSLGLFGIKERAELFGGKLIVESRPGAGTCLRVEIPIDMIPLGRITLTPNGS
ncbi:MAG: sensor histidine kinase [Candidatus Latescibacterota bacterium]